MAPFSLDPKLENELPELFKLVRLISTAGTFASRGSIMQEALLNSTKVIVPIIRPPEDCEVSITPPHVLKYDPLLTETSVRLLGIKLLVSLKSEFDLFQPIHCSLITRGLSDEPHYDALSYTWGDPRTAYGSIDKISSPEAWAATCWEIYCYGKPVSVSTNLYTALLGIRWLAAHGVLPDSLMHDFTGYISTYGLMHSALTKQTLLKSQVSLCSCLGYTDKQYQHTYGLVDMMTMYLPLGVEGKLVDIPDTSSVPFPTTGLPKNLIDRTESKDHPVPKLVQWTSDHEFDFRIIENHWDLRRTVAKKRNSPLWVVAQALRSTEAGNPRDKIDALLGLAWDFKKNQSAE